MQTQIINLIKKYKKAEKEKLRLYKTSDCGMWLPKDKENWAYMSGACDGIFCALKEFGMTKRDINKLEFDEN